MFQEFINETNTKRRRNEKKIKITNFGHKSHKGHVRVSHTQTCAKVSKRHKGFENIINHQRNNVPNSSADSLMV